MVSDILSKDDSFANPVTEIENLESHNEAADFIFSNIIKGIKDWLKLLKRSQPP